MYDFKDSTWEHAVALREYKGEGERGAPTTPRAPAKDGPWHFNRLTLKWVPEGQRGQDGHDALRAAYRTPEWFEGVYGRCE